MNTGVNMAKKKYIISNGTFPYLTAEEETITKHLTRGNEEGLVF